MQRINRSNSVVNKIEQDLSEGCEHVVPVDVDYSANDPSVDRTVYVKPAFAYVS